MFKKPTYQISNLLSLLKIIKDKGHLLGGTTDRTYTRTSVQYELARSVVITIPL